MLSDVFIKRRKVNPIQQKVAYIKTHTLCFNIMGMPYSDPAMGGIREARADDLPVYGVAYLLTPEDMRQVIVSEGYLLSIQGSGRLLCLSHYSGGILTSVLENESTSIPVTTLVARHNISLAYERLPSERYMVSYTLEYQL